MVASSITRPTTCSGSSSRARAFAHSPSSNYAEMRALGDHPDGHHVEFAITALPRYGEVAPACDACWCDPWQPDALAYE